MRFLILYRCFARRRGILVVIRTNWEVHAVVCWRRTWSKCGNILGAVLSCVYISELLNEWLQYVIP